MKPLIRSGAIIPVLVMLPNVVWMLMPSMRSATPGQAPLALSFAENVGRAAILILPFFFSLDLRRHYSRPVVIGMAAALAIYYLAWLRFFIGGGDPALLGMAFVGIPLPLALAPVAFLLLSSYLMHSWLVFGSAAVFGLFHVWVSALTL